MNDSDRTREQLVTELAQLRQRIAELEASESKLIRDITERKGADGRAYLQSAALNAAANAILITDRAGLIQWANPAFSDLTGYVLDEVVGKNPRELVKSNQHDRAFFQTLWETILSGHVWRGEMINRRKDGSLYNEDQTITPVRDAQGAISHFIAVKQDVTVRTRLEAALRASEERMRFALEAAGVGIWDMDHTTGVLRFSERVEAQYGMQPGTFVGTLEAFIALLHPEDRASVRESVANAMRSGGDFTLQGRTTWPDGTVHWLEGVGREYNDVDGRPLRALGISLDITGRHTLEAQYQQAQKMEAIGRLAGGVAHDFNNLLTVILGFCELLLADLDPCDARQPDISEIQKAGMRAAGLTRQLLTFSRQQIIEPTVLDLNVVVSEMRPMLSRLIGEDVTVLLDLAPEPAMMKADRGQVEQIVMNLAVNARDAMPTGGTLTIKTDNVDLDAADAQMHPAVKPGPSVVLTVTDTGTGMAPEVQARLFEPFFTTKAVGKGTGLGLATVHSIITQTGGHIRVQSEVGKGTSFQVYFPRRDAAEIIVGPPPPVARPRAGTQTILVVEDSGALRKLTERLLQRQGYTVLLAANAEEALRVVEAHASIDLLLTDVVLPGASGPELARRLVERQRGIHVIYMSGYTDDAIIQHGVLQPGIAFLHKPFSSETLGRKIREVLEE
jgi:PAS domain S-box-containing protein